MDNKNSSNVDANNTDIGEDMIGNHSGKPGINHALKTPNRKRDERLKNPATGLLQKLTNFVTKSRVFSNQEFRDGRNLENHRKAY